MPRVRLSLRLTLLLVALAAVFLGIEIPMHRYGADLVRDSLQSDYHEDEAFTVWLAMNLGLGLSAVFPILLGRGILRDRNNARQTRG